jgi:hypothetical protein
MTEAIPGRDEERPTWRLGGWWFVACELITAAALLGTLASVVRSAEGPAGRDLLPADTGPRDAYAACARFVDAGAMPSTAEARPNIGAWQWSRLADGRLRVRGYAEARSPVGEARRTYYQCDLVQLEAGRWRLDSLAVSPRRPT